MQTINRRSLVSLLAVMPVNGVGLRSQLAQPVEQVLFFAGEATHPTRAATVQGALESGIRAAHEILSKQGST